MPKPVDLAAAVDADINRAQPEEEALERPAIPGPPRAATPTPPAEQQTATTDVVTNSKPGSDTKGRSRPQRRPRPAASPKPSRAKELQVSVPRSLIEAVDAASRSRSDVVRAAFNRGAAEVVAALRDSDQPEGPMNLRRPTRRRARPEDPFAPMMLRLTDPELAVLDEAAAEAAATRSAFVTAILERELGSPGGR